MVFYRIYRPQKISELDSLSVRDSLYSIFSKFGKSPHAFLFSGPKGLGKTSAARIVAKVINCEKHANKSGQKSKLDEKEIEPCNKCYQCISITNGTNFDVLEIDAASNRGIDEIRDLKEKINLLPSKAAKKIYIIDEVHMLTTEAFNALLKTLEEPPEHAVFVLCTTELHKLPQTIISRCFRIDFKKATDEEIARSLTRIVKSENIKIDKETLLAIAGLSEGSFRDSTKILEELTQFAGRKAITNQLLEEKYNTVDIEKSLQQSIEAFKTKDAKMGFAVCAKLTASGTDFKYYVGQLVERFHNLLIESISEKGDFQTQELRQILELLSKTYQDTKYTVLPSLPLELAIVEWSKDNVQDFLDPDTTFPSVGVQLESSSSKPSLSVGTSAIGTDSSKTDNFFESLIQEVKLQNNLLAGVLRSCFAEKVADGKLEIVARSNFHKEKLQESKSLSILEDAANKISGKKVKVTIILRG